MDRADRRWKFVYIAVARDVNTLNFLIPWFLFRDSTSNHQQRRCQCATTTKYHRDHETRLPRRALRVYHSARFKSLQSPRIRMGYYLPMSSAHLRLSQLHHCCLEQS